ncbi:MAG: tetraacyldisaccharide 4'-kinase [Bacteroidales bacterium]|nr:tetraacyldisaccharide 4'-kinase [Candidatus Cacconaster merdequi]
MIGSFVLFPYYLTLRIRHYLFDKNILKTTVPSIPVVCIGNVTVGGTGKTPMTELVIKLLSNDYRVAVLSRGYGRKSKGFLFVGTGDSSIDVGDEPLQIKRKFPQITVAVDKERTRGIERLASLPENERPELIILDDGFQYRRLTPSRNILLIDYQRPIFKDDLLPIGRLRDLPSQMKRAECVVITKAPEFLEEGDRENLRHINHITEEQKMFVTTVKYLPPKAVFENVGDNRYIYSKEVFFFSGIANDKPVILHLSDKYELISHKTFSDHHNFTQSEMVSLVKYANNNPRTLLLTTEKDAQRLLNDKYLTEEVKRRLFFLPVETEFLSSEDTEGFRNYILSGLTTDKGNTPREQEEEIKETREETPAKQEEVRIPETGEVQEADKTPHEEPLPQDEEPEDKKKADSGEPVYIGPVEPVNGGLLF